jgi:hypothetical protein
MNLLRHAVENDMHQREPPEMKAQKKEYDAPKEIWERHWEEHLPVMVDKSSPTGVPL